MYMNSCVTTNLLKTFLYPQSKRISDEKSPFMKNIRTMRVNCFSEENRRTYCCTMYFINIYN